MSRSALICFVVTFLGCSAVFSVVVAEQTGEEIQLLIAHLEGSGCSFFRNGNWYDSRKAAAHLRKKYEVIKKAEKLITTEAFIAKGASRSSMSGQPYRVRCGESKAVESGTWLNSALYRLRHNPQ